MRRRQAASAWHDNQRQSQTQKTGSDARSDQASISLKKSSNNSGNTAMDERQAFHRRHLTLLSRPVAGALPCNRWKLNSYTQAGQQADDITQRCKGRKGKKNTSKNLLGDTWSRAACGPQRSRGRVLWLLG